MILTHRQKVWLGYATAWPLFFIAAVIVTMSAFFIFRHGGPPMGAHIAVVVGLLLTVACNATLLVAYVAHISTNQALSSSSRAVWYISIILGGWIAMVLYFYRHVW